MLATASDSPILLAVDQELGEGALCGVLQNSPIRSTRSRSGSIRTWRSSARAAFGERVETFLELELEERPDPRRGGYVMGPSGAGAMYVSRASPAPRVHARCDSADGVAFLGEGRLAMAHLWAVSDWRRPGCLVDGFHPGPHGGRIGRRGDHQVREKPDRHLQR